MLKIISFTLMGFITLILVNELIARVVLWQPPVWTDTGTPRQGLTSEAIGDWVPNQRAVWIDTLEYPFKVDINGDGFRNVEEMRPDSYRILILGDSMTFGLTVGTQDTFTHVAEKLLQNAHGFDLQILNNGLPGSTIVDHLAYLKDKGARLNPNMVLLVMHSNDISDISKRNRAIGFDREFGIQSRESVFLHDFRWFLRENSGLYVAVREFKNWLLVKFYAVQKSREISTDAGTLRRAFGQVSHEEQMARERIYTTSLVDAVMAVKELDAVPVLIHLPRADERDEELYRISREVSRSQSTAWIDLAAAFDGVTSEQAHWFRDGNIDPRYEGNVHMTRLGHLNVAHSLVEQIVPILKTYDVKTLKR